MQHSNVTYSQGISLIKRHDLGAYISDCLHLYDECCGKLPKKRFLITYVSGNLRSLCEWNDLPLAQIDSLTDIVEAI